MDSSSTNMKRNSKADDDHQRKGLKILPVEISQDILARLPVSSLVHSSNVSRTWRQLALEVSLLNLHLFRIGKKNPSLIFHCLDPAANQLYFVELADQLCDNDIVSEIDIPFYTSMPDKIHILDSCNGLLCISNHFVPRIISFDLSSEQFVEVLKPGCGGLNRPNYLLLVSGECLSAAVYLNSGEVEIWIMKEYNVKESWIKEFVIEATPWNTNPRSSNVHCFHVNGIWAKRVLHGKSVRVLCFLKNRVVLIQYRNGKLASYDPANGETTDLRFQGLPSEYNAVVHVSSLSWIDQQ